MAQHAGQTPVLFFDHFRFGFRLRLFETECHGRRVAEPAVELHADFVAASPDHLAGDCLPNAGRLEQDGTAGLEVLLAEDDADAALAQLDGWSGSALPAASVRFVGRPGALVDALGAVHGVDGVVIRPLALASTLPLLARVVPELRSAAPAGATVRERLGLGRPANRYASVN